MGLVRPVVIVAHGIVGMDVSISNRVAGWRSLSSGRPESFQHPRVGIGEAVWFAKRAGGIEVDAHGHGGYLNGWGFSGIDRKWLSWTVSGGSRSLTIQRECQRTSIGRKCHEAPRIWLASRQAALHNRLHESHFFLRRNRGSPSALWIESPGQAHTGSIDGRRGPQGIGG